MPAIALILYTRGVTAGGALRLPLHGGSGASPGPVGTAWFGAGSWVCCTDGRVTHSNGACLACPTREARALALAGYRSPGNREIAIRDQLLVYGSDYLVSFVDND